MGAKTAPMDWSRFTRALRTSTLEALENVPASLPQTQTGLSTGLFWNNSREVLSEANLVAVLNFFRKNANNKSHTGPWVKEQHPRIGRASPERWVPPPWRCWKTFQQAFSKPKLEIGQKSGDGGNVVVAA
ncbi:hypothetical protein QE152_g35641 [Popillia japonica]|uniref:Uncharacterized protein n=1 Tax=Popillia japonica TaxID=7064 RepID=A0AAW1IFC9_POPJA